MILDEAQFVKNHRAKTHQCAQRIVAPFKLAITGTPLENSLMDLWALLSLTAPGLFPHADRFAEYYRRPIERHGDAVRLRQLRRRIRPLMLRRTKAAVAAELPPKAEQVVDRRSASAAPPALSDPSAAGTTEGAGPDRRPRPQPVHRAPVADPVATAQPGPGAGGRGARRRTGGEGRGAGRRSGRDRPGGAPGPGLQPVHQLPRPDPRPGWTTPGSATPTWTGVRGTAIGSSTASDPGRHRSS